MWKLLGPLTCCRLYILRQFPSDVELYEIWWPNWNYHEDQSSLLYGHKPHHFLRKFLLLAFLLVNLDIYGNFPFCYNFLFKSKNKVTSFLGRFLKSIRVDLTINSIFSFLAIFHIFSLISCLQRNRVSKVFIRVF